MSLIILVVAVKYYMYTFYILYVKCPLDIQKYDRERDRDRWTERYLVMFYNVVILKVNSAAYANKSLFTVWPKGGVQKCKSSPAGSFLPYYRNIRVKAMTPRCHPLDIRGWSTSTPNRILPCPAEARCTVSFTVTA